MEGKVGQKTAPVTSWEKEVRWEKETRKCRMSMANSNACRDAGGCRVGVGRELGSSS